MNLKKIIPLCLALILSLSLFLSSSIAESGIILSDLSLATDDELEAARIKIVTEQRSRIKTKIVFDNDSLSIPKGKSAKINASIVDLPEGEKKPNFVWKSSNESIAKCANGNIRAVESGDVIISCSATLSDGTEISNSITVQVTTPVTQIVVNNKPVTMKKGATYKPSFSFKPENATDKSLSFSSSNEKIAKVGSDGTITALEVGSAKITAVTNDGSNKRATISVNVVLEFPKTLTSFQSKMMDSVSDQINDATDLTTTSNNRAILAAMLTLEFAYQCPDKTIDYTMPIYVSKSGTIAATVFAIQDDFVMVTYQKRPMSTMYGFLGGKDAAMAKKALEMVSDNVWTVSLSEYNKKLELLVNQIQ